MEIEFRLEIENFGNLSFVMGSDHTWERLPTHDNSKLCFGMRRNKIFEVKMQMEYTDLLNMSVNILYFFRARSLFHCESKAWKKKKHTDKCIPNPFETRSNDKNTEFFRKQSHFMRISRPFTFRWVLFSPGFIKGPILFSACFIKLTCDFVQKRNGEAEKIKWQYVIGQTGCTRRHFICIILR